jgi:adenylate cyclase
MQPNVARKFKTLVLVCVFTSFAGVIYQLIDENDLDFSSVTFGFPLGLAFGLMELFVFPKAEARFRQWPFTKLLLFKTFSYTALIYVVTLLVITTVGSIQGHDIHELIPYLTSIEQWTLVLYTIVVYSLLVFFIQINRLLGQGVLWKFVLGKYHKPREEERVFMFLDMKSSTTIAERLGHVRFYALLNELFHEISDPVLETKAEIYQYIGDEVVLTWKLDDGLKNANCLKTFFMFRENLLRNTDNYWKHFGVRPEFKAGLHFGKVITAQIGDLKREIVYNGDVVNTTSRIQNACNTYQRSCLISGELMNRLKNIHGFEWERIDAVTLRGKQTEMEIFSVDANGGL